MLAVSGFYLGTLVESGLKRNKKRVIRCNSNRESLYGLFFLVRTVRTLFAVHGVKQVSQVSRVVVLKSGSLRVDPWGRRGVPQLFTFHLRQKATESSSLRLH